MSKFILRSFALSVLWAAVAFGQQGTFGQIAYGGSWQTTFTLVNLDSSNAATVTLNFYGDSGLPLNAPVQGFSNTSAYTFAIPAGGAQTVALVSSDPTTTQGWATLTTTGTVRGQGAFRFTLPGGQLSEAVVPLTLPNTALCIIPFPPSNPVIQIPFDNTPGQYLTSLAFANTTSNPVADVIEFDDQSGNVLVSDTLSLRPMQHQAFVTTQAYSALAGKKGILKIHVAKVSDLTVLGLLSNATNAITTIIPITQ